MSSPQLAVGSAGGRAFWQLLVEVTLPHLVCVLRHGNSCVPRRTALQRSGAAKAPGFVGSCHVHPSRSLRAVLVPSLA